MTNGIPKIIHYCWFGKKEKPDLIKKCINSWKLLKEYEFIEWNEENFDVNSNKFIKYAYENKKWAFVTDYVRIKVLYEYGGIYLDTDVEIKKTFDDLLNNKMFLGFLYNKSIGTAVIGAEKKHKFLNIILDNYCQAKMTNDGKFTIKNYPDIKLNNNNDLITLLLVKNYPNIKLNNKYQDLDDLCIYPKIYFERPTFKKNVNYSLHRCFGSWFKSNPENRNFLAKTLNTFLGDVIYDRIRNFNVEMKLRNKKY